MLQANAKLQVGLYKKQSSQHARDMWFLAVTAVKDCHNTFIVTPGNHLVASPTCPLDYCCNNNWNELFSCY